MDPIDSSPLHSPQRQPEDPDAALRPKTLGEFVGQEAARENLRVFIEAARGRGEAMDHVLFFGPPGLGKTTLAQIVAREMGVGFRATSGPVIGKTGDLAALLTNLEPNDVLFIDEIVALGYRLKITEMDINDRNRAGTLAQRDADGATLAAGWLDMLMDYDELDEVLVWGMCDKYSWLQGFGAPRADGTPIRATPYDDLFQAKPLRATYMEAFQNTSVRAA